MNIENSSFKIMSAEQSDNLLHPDGYEYKHMCEINHGDKVRWYSQGATVVEVKIGRKWAYLMVVDPLDNKKKKFQYDKDDELLVKSASTHST